MTKTQAIRIPSIVASRASICLALLLACPTHSNSAELPKAERAFAESIGVPSGSEYFFTWGYTASKKPDVSSNTSNPFGDTYEQSASILSKMEADLRVVGLSRRDVVNLRAYLVANPKADFEGWHQAFSEVFGSEANSNQPTCTTIGISGLYLPDYLVEVEFTAVFPARRGGDQVSKLRTASIETNARWKSFGDPTWPMSTGKAITAHTDFLFSSALLPKPLFPNAAPQFAFYGTITQQSASVFEQMDAQLKQAGLGFKDVFFLRACISEGSNSVAKNVASFNEEYGKRFNSPTTPNRPTRTIVSIPGYEHKRQNLAIEYYAAYPSENEQMPELRAQIGAAVPSTARLVFFSGISLAEGEAIEAQIDQAISEVKRRLAAAGATTEDLVQLRAYLRDDAPEVIDRRVTAWHNAVESAFPDGNRPALSTLPVTELDNGSLILIEAVAAIE